jgi:hypothetical protein
VTPLHTTAPWYFLWLQGMLKIGDKFFWGIIAPGILNGLLVVLPYIEVGPSRRYGDRRVGLTGLAIFTATMAILSYMGTPWYAVSSTPDQEVVAELLPQTHPGPLRTSNWEELTAGTWVAAEWEAAPTPALRELLHTYDEELVKVEERLQDGVGYMIIEDWQTDLKRITFRIIWEGGPEGVCLVGQDKEYCQTTYYHRTANYWQKP